MNTTGRRALFLLLLIAFAVWLLSRIASHVPPSSRPNADPAESPETPAARLVGRGVQEGAPPRAPANEVAERGPDSTADALPPPVDLETIDRVRDLHGIVEDGAGRAVAGARLQAVTRPWQRGVVLASDRHDDEIPGPATRSASDGTFSLPLRLGCKVGLRVEAEGYAPTLLTGCQPGERVRVRLRPGVALRVTVVDDEGASLPDVDLALSVTEGRSRLTRRGRTDADGIFRFADLPGGLTASIEAKLDPLGGWSRGKAPLPEEGEGQHELVLTSGRVVRGRITDAETGRAVAGARVGMGWTFFKEARTDTDGRYALGGWTGNNYHDIHVLGAGYGRQDKSVGRETEIDFALKRAFALTGRVLGVGERPMANAPVAAVGSVTRDDAQATSTASGFTDAEGRFRLVDLRRDMPHLLVVMAEAHGRTLLEFDPPQTGEIELDLGDVRVPQGQRIAGRVLTDDEGPLPNARVTLTGANDDWARLRPDATEHTLTYYGREETRRSDDLGRFAFGDLAPGTYVLTADQEGGAPTTRRVLLPPGTDLDEVDLRFLAEVALHVLVVDPEGQGIPGVMIRQVASGGSMLLEATDASGQIVLRFPASAGDVPVELWSPEDRPFLVPESITVPAHAGEHKIVLQPAATIRGRLVGADGEVMVGSLVEARRNGERVAEAWVREGGRFVLEFEGGAPVDVIYTGRTWFIEGGRGSRVIRLPLEARAEGVPADGREILLEAHQVSADRTLDVQVLDLEGKPAEGLEVVVTPCPAETPETLSTDGEGRVHLSGFTAHAVEILVRPPRARQLELARQVVREVVPGGERVVIHLVAPRLIEGVVLDASGNPAAGASVSTILSPGNGEGVGVRCDAKGRFALPLSPDRSAPLTLQAFLEEEGGALQFAELADVAPGSVDLRLELRPHRGY